MHKLCNIDIRHREAILPELERFVDRLMAEYTISSVHVFGSFVTGKLHEGSDIDILIVGEFLDRYVDRVRKVIGLSDLPIEPLVYTNEEFTKKQEDHDPFLTAILQSAHQMIGSGRDKYCKSLIK